MLSHQLDPPRKLGRPRDLPWSEAGSLPDNHAEVIGTDESAVGRSKDGLPSGEVL
jgi:hypothetical protein